MIQIKEYRCIILKEWITNYWIHEGLFHILILCLLGNKHLIILDLHGTLIFPQDFLETKHIAHALFCLLKLFKCNFIVFMFAFWIIVSSLSTIPFIFVHIYTFKCKMKWYGELFSMKWNWFIVIWSWNIWWQYVLISYSRYDKRLAVGWFMNGFPNSQIHFGKLNHER